MRALALFSGGLDSALAIKVIQEQGIEVIALNYVSYFFGGKNEKSDTMAEQLGVELKYVDFKEIHREVVKNPASGYGKNMNPCIDCHALMMEEAGKLFKELDASFIVTGEVLGERPMSQNYHALKKVEKLSTIPGYIVRPLSAKLLPITIPEEKGWIDRNQLLDIQGRSRRRQLELVKKYGLTVFPMPGGGCSLTEPNYSRKLKVLKEDDYFDDWNMFYIMRKSRFLRLDKGKYFFIGREEGENNYLENYLDKADLFVRGYETPGPLLLGFGNFNEMDLDFAKNIFSRYSKEKGKNEVSLNINNNKEIVSSIDLEQVKKDIERIIV